FCFNCKRAHNHSVHCLSFMRCLPECASSNSFVSPGCSSLGVHCRWLKRRPPVNGCAHHTDSARCPMAGRAKHCREQCQSKCAQFARTSRSAQQCHSLLCANRLSFRFALHRAPFTTSLTEHTHSLIC